MFRRAVYVFKRTGTRRFSFAATAAQSEIDIKKELRRLQKNIENLNALLEKRTEVEKRMLEEIKNVAASVHEHGKRPCTVGSKSSCSRSTVSRELKGGRRELQ